MAGGFAVVIVRLCHGLRAEGLGAGTGFVGRGWYHHEWRDYDKAPEKRGPDRRFHGG